jgi:hypothetical protein
MDYGVVTPQSHQLANINKPQNYPPHPKTHRMLLNVARAYNIANMQLKALSKNNQPPSNFVPSHTQVIFKMQNQPTNDINTHLYPIDTKMYPAVHDISI